MKVKFSNLKEGDTIWCVYNKNYLEKDNYILTIKSAHVIRNFRTSREIYDHDWYKEEFIDIEEYNHIEFKFIEFDYSRDYDKFYDEKGQMSIFSNTLNNGPSLEIFVNKEDAIRYAKLFMNQMLTRNINTIEKLKIENVEIKQSIKEIEEV